jgi:hypothetical protein
MTKRSSLNIIITLRGIDTLETKEGCNDDDDDDNDTNILDDKTIKAQMIVTTMSLDPNIKILPLVILLGHKSQGLHNHRHLAFCNSYT